MALDQVVVKHYVSRSGLPTHARHVLAERKYSTIDEINAAIAQARLSERSQSAPVRTAPARTAAPTATQQATFHEGASVLNLRRPVAKVAQPPAAKPPRREPSLVQRILAQPLPPRKPAKLAPRTTAEINKTKDAILAGHLPGQSSALLAEGDEKAQAFSAVLDAALGRRPPRR